MDGCSKENFSRIAVKISIINKSQFSFGSGHNSLYGLLLKALVKHQVLSTRLNIFNILSSYGYQLQSA